MSKVDFRYNIEAETPNLCNNFGGYSMLNITKKLTQARVQHLFNYDKNKGVLTWNNPSARSVKNGDKAGMIAKKTGYMLVKILGQKHFVHRIIWLHQYGYTPEVYIDHINHDKTDNRLCNLREVTIQENQKNLPLYKTNTSGHSGVTWNKKLKKWVVSISDNKKYVYLGSFDDINEAINVRKQAEIKYDYHTNHGKGI